MQFPRVLSAIIALWVATMIAVVSPCFASPARGDARAVVAVRAPTPYLRFIEHACDEERDSRGPENASLIGDFTGDIYQEPARGRKYRPATNFELTYSNKLHLVTCHVIARGRHILHLHFRGYRAPQA